MPAHLLVVDDDATFRETLAALLRDDGHHVETVGGAGDALPQLAERSFHLLIVDLRMPEVDGLRLIETLRQRGETTPIMVISGFGTVESTVEALHAGADDVLTKPVEPDVLSARVARLLERRPRLVANAAGAAGNLLGHSAGMREVLDAIRLVAPSDATVLIGGETGTGKELAARAIHAASPRHASAFVALNCAAVADGVLESELFGHVRGAFTGAVRDRAGVFQAAHRGTLFLDEVGDMSAAMQHRLLRSLQEREITPVGQVQPIRVDVRVIAATNRDLRSEVREGRFREDLFYRLNVFHLKMPALRARRDDIPLLAGHIAREVQGREVRFTPLAMRMLQAHAWPGNVRELFAVVQSALIRSSGDAIEPHHLPAEVRGAIGGGVHAGDERRYDAGRVGGDEQALIAAALADAGGVRARAAELLGMGRTTLWRKLRRYESPPILAAGPEPGVEPTDES
jgi:two-component system response regulator HydG